MAFTVGQLANILNAALPFYIKGEPFKQTIQDRPLLAALRENQKTFPGGTKISIPVKGDYTTTIAGYSHNDIVGYQNPSNIKRVEYLWKEIHAGIGVTHTELKIDGISVDESKKGGTPVEHSGRDATVLTGLLDDKLEDMGEGYARGMNNMLWLDGTQDAKQVPGVLSFLTDTPAVGVTGGLDRATTPWWRHRALVGANKITASKVNQTLTATLRAEARQLRRYSKKQKYKLFAGSKFIEALEGEVYEKGILTQEGFTNSGKTSLGMASISMLGLGTIEYDPTLDDLGLSYRLYIIDLNGIRLMPMEGEIDKDHAPERPYDQYAFYRAMTWTGGLVAQQLNSSGVYEVAA